MVRVVSDVRVVSLVGMVRNENDVLLVGVVSGVAVVF